MLNKHKEKKKNMFDRLNWILLICYIIIVSSELQNALSFSQSYMEVTEDLQLSVVTTQMFVNCVAVTKFDDCDILAFLSESAASRLSENISGFP